MAGQVFDLHERKQHESTVVDDPLQLAGAYRIFPANPAISSPPYARPGEESWIQPTIVDTGFDTSMK